MTAYSARYKYLTTTTAAPKPSYRRTPSRRVPYRSRFPHHIIPQIASSTRMQHPTSVSQPSPEPSNNAPSGFPHGAQAWIHCLPHHLTAHKTPSIPRCFHQFHCSEISQVLNLTPLSAYQVPTLRLRRGIGYFSQKLEGKGSFLTSSVVWLAGWLDVCVSLLFKGIGVESVE